MLRGGNCLICLHHEHATESCFGKDQAKTICGMEGCQKRHHPSLHSSPQGTIQSVQMSVHGSALGYIVPGVDMTSGVNLVVGRPNLQETFVAKTLEKKNQKIAFVEATWTGGTKTRIDEERNRELKEMREVLQLPLVDGINVFFAVFKFNG